MELFALSLISMSFLISALVKKASQATNIGFLLFILGFFLLLGAAFIYNSAVNAPAAVRIIFSLFSPSMFQLGLSELGQASSTELSDGIPWSSIGDASILANQSYSFNDMYGWLILDFFIYLLLALYLDNVLPSNSSFNQEFFKKFLMEKNFFFKNR